MNKFGYLNDYYRNRNHINILKTIFGKKYYKRTTMKKEKKTKIISVKKFTFLYAYC